MSNLLNAAVPPKSFLGGCRGCSASEAKASDWETLGYPLSLGQSNQVLGDWPFGVPVKT